MSNPKITMQLIDPGSLLQPANIEQTPTFMGVCETGDFDVMHEFTTEEDAVAWGTRGHLIDVIKVALLTMPSVRAMRVAADTAGTFEGTDTDDELTASAYTGTPLQFLKGVITVAEGSSGLVSAGGVKVRISLDAWDIPNIDATQTEIFDVPTSGIVPLPDTGLSITLTVGQTPVVGQTLHFEATPGHPNSTSIGSAFDAVILPQAGDSTYQVVCGDPETASAANTLGQAVGAKVTAFFAKARFMGALFGAGRGTDAESVTAFANTSFIPPFESAGYGGGYCTLPKATAGRSFVLLCEHEIAAIRIANSLISTDPGRTASGALSGVVGVNYDAAVEGSALEQGRLSALRNWVPDAEGFFINRQRMLAATGSNYVSWQHAAIMIVALRIVHKACFRLVLDTLRATAGNTIDARDASDIEESGNTDLEAALLDPTNARGTKGHVSAAKCHVNLDIPFPGIEISVNIRPHGYPTDIVAKLQYAGAV